MPDARMMRRSQLLPRPVSLGATKHTMLGPGGKIVEPRSESAVIGFVLSLLEEAEKFQRDPKLLRHHLADAKEELQKLQEQVGAGYHRNPRRGVFSAGNVVGKIGDDVHDVRYTHADDGENYEHEFSGEVEVWAVERNGKRELLLSHKRGLPLWDDF